jgi:hypothetical protein
MGPFLSRISMKVAIGVIATILLVSVGAYASGVFSPPAKAVEMKPMETVTDTLSLSGHANEGQEVEEPLELKGVMLHHIKMTLAWQDDNPDSEPDQFEMRLVGQGCEETAYGTVSPIVIEIDLASGESMGSSSSAGCHLPDAAGSQDSGEDQDGDGWTLYVTLADGGDRMLGPLGIVTIDDSSNDYSVEVEYTYCGTCAEGMGGEEEDEECH